MKVKLLILVLWLSSGCGYSNGPAVLHDKFSEIQTEIINPSCGASNSSCHSYSTTASGLSLKPPVSYYQLMHHIITSNAPKYHALVVPGFPDSSFLYEVVSDPQLGPSNPMGVRMPKGEPSLSEDQIAAIKSWIQKGALNN